MSQYTKYKIIILISQVEVTDICSLNRIQSNWIFGKISSNIHMVNIQLLKYISHSIYAYTVFI